MRLIDAEYLKEHVFACATNGRPLHHMELSELFDAIDDVPTIEPEPCEDAVSREDAIDTLDDEITITGKSNAYVVMDYVQRVKRKLENLPSVTPERKTGKWITQMFGSWAECSECHELYDIPISLSSFCPNCGADMRGEQE